MQVVGCLIIIFQTDPIFITSDSVGSISIWFQFHCISIKIQMWFFIVQISYLALNAFYKPIENDSYLLTLCNVCCHILQNWQFAFILFCDFLILFCDKVLLSVQTIKSKQIDRILNITGFEVYLWGNLLEEFC